MHRNLHLGRFEFLLGAEESADPAVPELDDATLELIRKLSSSYFPFSFSFFLAKERQGQGPQKEGRGSNQKRDGSDDEGACDHKK